MPMAPMAIRSLLRPPLRLSAACGMRMGSAATPAYAQE